MKIRVKYVEYRKWWLRHGPMRTIAFRPHFRLLPPKEV